MFVRCFDHSTIRTNRLEATRDFYVKLLNLKVGLRPAFKFDGYWLYLDDRPVFHLIELAMTKEDEVAKYLGFEGGISRGSGLIDHLAFRIEGYGSLLAKAKRNNWEFFERTVPDIHEHQVFFRDPNQITIELIFHDDEYLDWQRAQE
jgi:catechol 2,3-dioxygenase-like lactoylglutathione lyase family enzyme